jgi:hypothetical protein
MLPIPAKEGGEDDIVAFAVLDSAALTEEAGFAHAAAMMPKYMRPGPHQDRP